MMRLALITTLLLPARLLFGQAAEPVQEPTQEASPAAVADVPIFTAEVELVTVDVVATDKKGNPVTGLTAEDFIVEEDGVPQEIVSFDGIELPEEIDYAPPPPAPLSTNYRERLRPELDRTYVILIDDLHLTPLHAHRAKVAVAQFLKTGLRPGDHVTLVSTSGSAWWSVRMPQGRDDLVEMLKRLEGRLIPDMSPDRVTEWEAMRIHVYNDRQVTGRVTRRLERYGFGGTSQSSRGLDDRIGGQDPYVRSRASEIYYAASVRNRLTLKLIKRLLQSLTAAKGRKSMLLVSGGFIHDPNLVEFKDVITASRHSNVAIYFLDTRGLEMPSYMSAEFGPALDTRDVSFAFLEQREAAEGTESLAIDSGGFTVKNSNDLAGGIKRIIDESRIYYLLGYVPSNTAQDGRYRKIKVRTTRKDIKLRARKGYYAALPDGSRPEDEYEDGTDPDFQRALDSPYVNPDLPMRMTAYVFDEMMMGKAGVVLAADVDVRNFGFREEEGRLKDTLEFLLVVVHRETGEFHRYDQQVNMKLRPQTRDKLEKTWFPIRRDFELPVGGYQAKLVVRDSNSQILGSLVHAFDVPELEGLRVSTPVMSDTLQPKRPGSDDRPRPAMLARREFPAGAMLYCSFDVYGATKDESTGMPRVLAGYEVLRKSDGGVQERAEPSEILPTSLGRLSRMVATALSAASPGDYEIVLRLEDQLSGEKVEVREPFSLAEPTGD